MKTNFKVSIIITFMNEETREFAGYPQARRRRRVSNKFTSKHLWMRKRGNSPDIRKPAGGGGSHKLSI